MKLKSVILATLSGTLITGGTIGISVALTSCSNSNVRGVVYEKMGDPYKELSMLGRSLDYSYFKNQSDRKYEKKAEEINSSVKKYIKDLSTNLDSLTAKKGKKIDNLKNKSIVFLKGADYNFNKEDSDDNKINALNKFHMEQPILFSSIYANANDETPGLGLNFPAPNDENGWKLFDDWFEIGAKALNSGNNSIPTDITSYWSNTADFVIYLYDSKSLTLEQEINLVKYVWDDNSKFNSSNKAYAKKILKKDAAIKKVIPLDIEFFYNSTFSVYGTANMTRLFVNLLSDASDGELGNDFGGLLDSTGGNKNSGFKPRNLNDFNTLPTNPFDNISLNETNFIQPEQNKTPVEFGDKVNLLSTAYNTIGQLVSLGILPQYSIKNIELGESTEYENLTGLVTSKLSKNSTPIISNPSQIKIVTNNELNNNNDVNNFNLYCVVADRSSFKYGDDWSTENDIKPFPKMENYHVDYNNLIKEGYIKTCAYTERNDTEYSQTPYNLDINVINNNNVETLTLKDYYNSKGKNYFDLM